MASIALLLTTILLGLQGFLALQRLRVYSIILLALSFYGFYFVLTCAAMIGIDQQATERAVVIFTAGGLFLCTAFSVFDFFLSSVLKSSREIWAWRFSNYKKQHLLYSGFFLLLSLMIFLLFQQDYSINWEAARISPSPLLILAPFMMFLGCPGLVTAWRSSKFIFIFFFSCALCVFVFSGSRAGALTAMAMYAWFWLSERDHITLNLRTIFGFLIFVVAIFAVHALLRGLRNFSPEELTIMIMAGDLSGIASGIIESYAGGFAGSESSIVKYLVFSAGAADESIYGFLTSVQRVLMLFLPGSYFPDKPIDVTYILSKDALDQGLFNDSQFYDILVAQHAAGIYGSLHPTLFGELFLAGEWVGLFIGLLFFACICMVIEVLLLKLKPINALLLLGPTVVGMAMIARGNSVIGFGYFFYLLPIVLIATTSVQALVSFINKFRVS